MAQQDFKCSITADVTPAVAFESVRSRVPEWWTENFEGNSENAGDVFTTRFGETWATFKIQEIIPGKKIVWYVTGCNLHFLKDKQEWKNTKMLWEFSTNNQSARIDFTHIGLVPGIECYEDCCGGWTHYITKSLFELLTKTKGQPDHEDYSARYKQ